MAYAVFDFEGNKIKIQCNIEDTIQKILTNFASKIKIELDSLLFLYGGNLIEIDNNELIYEDLANQIDLENKLINILVYKRETYTNTSLGQTNDFIIYIKPKLSEILVKYLDDREYLETKVDKWKDAILNECNTVFSSNKKYKAL